MIAFLHTKFLAFLEKLAELFGSDTVAVDDVDLGEPSPTEKDTAAPELPAPVVAAPEVKEEAPKAE